MGSIFRLQAPTSFLFILLCAETFAQHTCPPDYYDLNKTFANAVTPNGWFKNCSFCSWIGITCQTANIVSELVLTAPFEVNGQGSVIDLSQLPTSIIRLDLSDTNYSGTVDASSLPSGLQALGLTNNNFKGVLDLAALPRSLTHVQLGGNQFTGSLNFTSLPPSLTTLMLNDNMFTGSIDWASLKTSSVKNLKLSNNSLTGTFDGKSLPASMITLEVDQNQLAGAVDLTALPQTLRHLYLHKNAFTGSVDFTSFPVLLEDLDLGNNMFSGVADLKKVLTDGHIKTFKINDNKFQGTVDLAIGNLGTQLNVLEIQNNSFSGSISFTKLPAYSNPDVIHLEIINASWNNFTELTLNYTLTTTQICKNPNIHFDFAKNKLKGSLNISQIRGLDLNVSDNELTGSLDWSNVQTDLCPLTVPNQWRLRASRNKLTGSIDFSMFNISMKLHVRASKNLLNGPLIIPNRLLDFYQLKLADNSLTGTVDLSYVQANVLNLKKNKLEGSIDLTASFGTLESLILSNNKFSGDFDICGFKQRTDVVLDDIDVSGNDLTGSIDLGCVLPETKSINLMNNRFSGTLNMSKMVPSPFPLKLMLLKNAFRGPVRFDGMKRNLKNLTLDKSVYCDSMGCSPPIAGGSTGPRNSTFCSSESTCVATCNFNECHGPASPSETEPGVPAGEIIGLIFACIVVMACCGCVYVSWTKTKREVRSTNESSALLVTDQPVNAGTQPQTA